MPNSCVVTEDSCLQSKCILIRCVTVHIFHLSTNFTGRSERWRRQLIYTNIDTFKWENCTYRIELLLKNLAGAFDLSVQWKARTPNLGNMALKRKALFLRHELLIKNLSHFLAGWEAAYCSNILVSTSPHLLDTNTPN